LLLTTSIVINNNMAGPTGKGANGVPQRLQRPLASACELFGRGKRLCAGSASRAAPPFGPGGKESIASRAEASHQYRQVTAECRQSG
jgi:hypothetical protein